MSYQNDPYAPPTSPPPAYPHPQRQAPPPSTGPLYPSGLPPSHYHVPQAPQQQPGQAYYGPGGQQRQMQYQVLPQPAKRSGGNGGMIVACCALITMCCCLDAIF